MPKGDKPPSYKSYIRGRSYQGPKSPIAKSTRVDMRWVEDVSMDAPVGSRSFFVVRANSIFQPNFTTGGTHQPYGHDQWAAFYEHYVVESSLCTAQFTPEGSTAATGSAIVGIGLRASTLLATNNNTFRETPNTAYRGMNALGSQGPVVVRKAFSARQFFSTADPQNDPEQRTHFGVNPTEEAFFHIAVLPADISNDLNPIDMQVTVTYHCILSEPKLLPGS